MPSERPRPEDGLPAPLDLMGVNVHPLDAKRLVDILIEGGRRHDVRKVCYVNAHAMNLVAGNAAFAEALRSADVVFCDGYGVKWAARVLGVHIPHRLTPPDWIDAFAASAADAGQAVFALGDEPGIAAAFQQRLAERHNGYVDAGSHHGFFHKEGAENDGVIEMINASGATHLLVGFGMPLQELWMKQNANRLRPRTLISVGALFRWYAGAETRAPLWMSRNGLEWAHRLARHPVRHFRRYVIGNPAFVLRVIRYRLGRAVRG